MEINQRMSKRLGWLLGVAMLVAIGLLLACGTTYNSSSDGLVLVGSQGSALVQSFSFSLASGHLVSVSNSTNDTGNSSCVLPGLPSAMVLDSTGSYAYAIINATDQCQGSTTGILSFKVSSNGTVAPVGKSPVQFNPVAAGVAVVPGTMVADPSGKFLFVADRSTTDGAGNPVPGAVSVFSISNGTATEVTGSPFSTPVPPTQMTTDIISVAATPTVFPPPINGVNQAVCTGSAAPTAEYLYAVDYVNSLVFEFAVDTSTGALGIPTNATTILSFPTDTNPAGVAVDPCNRFVYVSGSLNNKVNAYTMCNGSTTQSSTCPNPPNGSLIPVSGSPFSMPAGVNGPGPLVVDPFGNNVYVLSTSNQLSTFHISPVSGSLTAGTPAAVATGAGPTSIAIRSDDSWMFVTNFQAATLSQYVINPATGALNPTPGTPTDNYPFGVAVK
jgi:6-phosphogluconolactonase (cycloisomerase 2 family)